MNTQSLTFRQKIIVVVVGILSVLFVVLLISLLGKEDGMAVKIVAVPRDAKIKFTSESKTASVSKKGSVTLDPGEYAIEASKEGFETSNLSMVVSENNQTIVVMLAPSSEAAQAWADKNSRMYTDAEAVAGKLSEEAGEKFREDNPILGYLPHDSGYYRIDYGQEGNELTLTITADRPVGRQVALEKIRSWGFEPSDYRITFSGLVNPFDGSSQ